jgi:hypothetical protein
MDAISVEGDLEFKEDLLSHREVDVPSRLICLVLLPTLSFLDSVLLHPAEPSPNAPSGQAFLAFLVP